MSNFPTLKKITSLLSSIEVDLKKNLNIARIKTRPNAGDGLWLLFLVPACLCSAAVKAGSGLLTAAACCSVGLCLASILFVFFTALTPRNLSTISTLSKGWTVPALVTCSLCEIICESNIVMSVLSGVSTSLGFRWLLTVALRACPLSFSVGESILVTQAVVLFIYHATINMFSALLNTPESDIDIIVIIVQAGLLGVGVVVSLLYHSSPHVDMFKFSIVVGSVISCLVFLLHLLLSRSPVLWMIVFLVTDLKKLGLISYWVAASSLAVLAVLWKMSSGKHAGTSQRKVFHILAVAVYLPGLVLDRPLMLLASGIAGAALIALETIRKLQLGSFSKILNEGFIVFADEKDIGGISLTPLYLLAGMASPLALGGVQRGALLPVLSGVLSVGIGDSAASYIGSMYGMHKWTGSKKSIEGSIANVVSQLIAVGVLGSLGCIEGGPRFPLLVAVLVNAFVELTTDQVDNLTLPLVTFFILNMTMT